MKHRFVFLWCAASSLCALPAVAADFSVRLSLANAHLRELHFGCAEGAANGFDRELDDFAPPPGIETGYVGFIPGDKTPSLFYRDMRAFNPEQTWPLYVKPDPNKAVVIRWDANGLPANYSFTIHGESTDVAMADAEVVEIASEQTLIITAKLKTTASEGVAVESSHAADRTPKETGVAESAQAPEPSSSAPPQTRTRPLLLLVLGAALFAAIFLAYVRGR